MPRDKRRVVVLRQHRRGDKLRLKALRMQIKAGIDALKHGRFTEVASADLDEFLERLADPPTNARADSMARFRLPGPRGPISRTSLQRARNVGK